MSKCVFGKFCRQALSYFTWQALEKLKSLTKHFVTFYVIKPRGVPCQSKFYIHAKVQSLSYSYSACGTRVLKWARFVFLFVCLFCFCPFFWCCRFCHMCSTVLITSLFVCFLLLFFFGGGRGGQLGWFVFIRIRNTKPWYHFHMCTVVLWTKIVVELMLLWSGLQR